VWEGYNLSNLNLYIIVDPAGTVKKKADYTTMWVVGCGSDKNFYILDLIRDKFDLTGKTNALFMLVKRYTTRTRKPIVYYEKVSMQSDIEHIEYIMNQLSYRFSINPAYSPVPKGQRIEALEPLFREGRIWLCKDAWHVNWEGTREDMLSSWVRDEYLSYPFCAHDDGLDSLSRLADNTTGIELAFPDEISMELLQRTLLESRGIKFEDAVEVEYEPF
jgi:predicted phage terminase large subunit-like protein